MPKDADALEYLSPEARTLFELIPPDGSSIGNTRLRSRSGFSEDDYWRFREELLDADLIQTGKGRGGSVSRISPTETEAEAQAELVEREEDLYPHVEKWLNDSWGKGPREMGDFFSAKITAGPSGYRRKSGQWTRPDITVVQVNRYEFLPGAIVDVTSFEVKPYAASGNLAIVYEAAAHQRLAHNAYLVVELPSGELSVPDHIETELTRYGVGLLTIWKESDGAWSVGEVLEPTRVEPDPSELDTFLRAFFRDDPKNLNVFKAAIGK